MRPVYTYVLSLAFFLTFNTVTFAQQITDAVSYLTFIGNQFEQVSSDMMSYTSAASHGKSARKVDKKRSEVLQTVKEVERNVRLMKPFNGDHSYRDSVIAYFQISSALLNEDYAKIVDMEAVAEESYDLMEAYMLAKERANSKLDHAFVKVNNQQKAFASNNNITLTEGSSKLSQKMGATKKVLGYHDALYLIFFKSYKDEVYFMDALSKGDINALEQTKNSLLDNAITGLKNLGPISGFEGDASLKNACQQLLAFYKLEGGAKSNDLVEFFLLKENFDKMKAAMDAKRPTEGNQVEIDKFNKLVLEYNNSTNKFNSVNNEFNKKRGEFIDKWNKASAEFLDDHIPKYK